MIHEQNEKKTLLKRVICCRFRKMDCISGLMEFLGGNNRIYNNLSIKMHISFVSTCINFL